MAPLRPRIGIDCDGVVLSWIRGFRAFLAKEHGIQLDLGEEAYGEAIDYPSLQHLGERRVWGLVHEYCCSSDYAELQDPQLPALWPRLQAIGDLHLVTMRHETSQDATIRLLRSLGLHFSSHSFNPRDGKRGYDVLIDDNPANLATNTQAGGLGILYTQPSNEHVKEPAWPRVSSWMEVLDHLQQRFPTSAAAPG